MIEIKAVIGMLLLFGALVMFVVYEMPETLMWAVVAAISGLAGFAIAKSGNGKPK